MRLVLEIVFGALVCGPVFAQGSPYVGQQSREIKALSSQEQADLLAGRGMGFARAGELNHYPGPAHVLELRDKLGLSAQQIEVVKASLDRMSSAAKPLGAKLVEQERELDAGFRDGSITPSSLAGRTAEIADLQGKLRAIHLAAHLEMRSVLTPDQITAYDKLRGYADNAPTAPDHTRMHPG